MHALLSVVALLACSSGIVEHDATCVRGESVLWLVPSKPAPAYAGTAFVPDTRSLEAWVVHDEALWVGAYRAGISFGEGHTFDWAPEHASQHLFGARFGLDGELRGVTGALANLPSLFTYAWSGAQLPDDRLALLATAQGWFTPPPELGPTLDAGRDVFLTELVVSLP